MQTAFSAPGLRVPDDESEVTNDNLIDTMKSLIAERTEARGKVRELKDLMKSLESSSKESKNSHKTLKQHLIAAEVSHVVLNFFLHLQRGRSVP